MANNFVVAVPGGSETIAARDDGTAKHQKAQLTVNGADVQRSAPLPVTGLSRGDTIDVAGVELTVKFAAISASADGDNTLVAAVSSKKIRVISLFLVVLGSGTVQFKSSTTSNLTGAMTVTAGVPLVLPKNEYGWFETVSGQLLNLVNGVGVDSFGALSYVEV